MSSVRGFIREIRPRYSAIGQRKALAEAGVTNVYEQGTKRSIAVRADLERSLRNGDVVAVLHAFLLADPAKRGHARADLWKAIDAIESRGASIWEVYTGLRSTEKRQRDEMLRAAVEALAKGRHKRSERDKRLGRPGWKPSELEKAKANAIWGNTSRYPRWQDALMKLRELDKRWSQARAYRELGKRS